MSRTLDRVHRACVKLRDAWPKAAVAAALDAEIDDALAEHFGADPAAVVSARILADRRKADEAAHAKATERPPERSADVLSLRAGRKG